MLGVDIDLDDLGLLREVIDVILGQGPEDGKPGADGKHDIRLGKDPHGRLGAHVADGADGQGMITVEGVVVEIGNRHRRRQVLRDGLDDVEGVCIDRTPSGDDHRVFSPGEKLGCLIKTFQRAAATGIDPVLGGLEDRLLNLTIEIIPGNIIQDSAPVRVSDPEGGSQAVRRPFGVGHPDRRLGDGPEDRYLIAFLETIPTDRGGSSRGRNNDKGGMTHIGRRHRRHHIGDAGAVLAGHHTGPACHPGIGVLHVGCTLFMTDGNEFDACRREEIQHVHKGRTHNPANMVYAFGQQGLDNRFTGRHSYLFHLFITSI